MLCVGIVIMWCLSNTKPTFSAFDVCGSIVVKDDAIGVGGQWFDPWIGQIGHSSPALQRFFEAILLSQGDGPRYSLDALA